MAVRLQLSKKEVKRQLDENGFCVCPNVITPEETEEIILEFRKWQTTIPNHDKTHSTIDPHGIYKHNEVGHQFHAWKTRTNKNGKKKIIYGHTQIKRQIKRVFIVFRDLWH